MSLNDDFKDIIAEAGPVTLWRTLFELAEADLAAAHPGEYTIEDIGRGAWNLLAEHEKPAALDELTYTYWSAAMEEQEQRERREQVAAGTRLLPGDMRTLQLDVAAGQTPGVTVQRAVLRRALAEMSRLTSAAEAGERS